MGRRGPKPGWKHGGAAQAAPPSSTPQAPKDNAPSAKQEVVVQLSAADRENPQKLSGQALRELAHRRGMSKSDIKAMDDAKIRVQLSYLVARQYEEAA